MKDKYVVYRFGKDSFPVPIPVGELKLSAASQRQLSELQDKLGEKALVEVCSASQVWVTEHYPGLK